MAGKRLAVIRRQRVHQRRKRRQTSPDRIPNRGRRRAGHQFETGVFRYPVDHRHHRTPMPGSDDRIDLPVAHPGRLVDHRRTLADIDPVRDQAAPGRRATAAVVCLATPPESVAQGPASRPIRPDVTVDPGRADGQQAIKPETAGYLLRIPTQGQRLLDQGSGRRGHLARHGRGHMTALCRQAMRLLHPVSPPTGIPLHLPADRRDMAARCPGDRPQRIAPFKKRLNPASLREGQVMVS